MSLDVWIPYLLLGVKALLYVVSIVFFLSGLDDFFIDLYHLVRRMYRKLFVMRKYHPLSEDHLLLPNEQPVALMIPAWDESAVIRQMLDNTLRTLNYSNYHIFVGTYPNDLATQNEVERIRERYDNVHRIVCPKDGPTNKADCLNWIYQGIRLMEKEKDLKFEIFVIDDAEDILHPLSLKLFNYLIPRKDMVQLPVLPLERKWYQFTAGHYVDEFAENHSKDMVVRERLSRSIPSAGVGCAYSRRAFDEVSRDNQNQLFSIDSLTEDYDFGFRLRRYNLKQVFVNHAVERATTKKSFWTGRTQQAKVKEYIATREYFPSTFGEAVRQKARWVLGISLQGWANLGWSGSGWIKYMLFRDRKSLLTNLVNVLGYVVVLTVLAILIIPMFFPELHRYPPLVERGTWLWYVILADTFFLVVRLFQRAYHVLRIYGWPQALLSIPRQVWGNVINFAASGRAVYLFSRFLLTGQLMPWDKTAHVFPSEAELTTFRRKLGDLLLERRFITVGQLEQALVRQKERGRPLGAILIEMGLVQEDDLVMILGTQLQLSTQEIDPYETPLELLEVLPRSLASRYGVFPVELLRGGRLLVAAESPPRREQVEELEKALERPVEFCLSTRSDVAFAIRRGYERLAEADEEAARKSRLGRLLLEQNLITPDQLRQALKAQRRSYAQLGEILLNQNFLSPATLREAAERYAADRRGRFGDFLVQNNYITLEQLEQALAHQKSRFQRLGDVIIEQGILSQEALQRFLPGVANED